MAKTDPTDRLSAMRQAVRSFLDACGLDVEGTELGGTPENVARAWNESFIDGYDAEPAEILKTAYASKGVAGATETVLVKDVPFHGMCPHHLLPFHGRAHVAYVPGQKLASLSSPRAARGLFCPSPGNSGNGHSADRGSSHGTSRRSRHRGRARHRSNLHDGARCYARGYTRRNPALHGQIQRGRRSSRGLFEELASGNIFLNLAQSASVGS